MHILTKDNVQTEEQAKALGLDIGAHLLTINLEADGAAILATEKAKLDTHILGVARTASGGVEIKFALEISEPAPEAAPAPVTPEEEASAYLKSKDFGPAAIKAQLERFGAGRILAMRDREAANKDKQLDQELESVLSGAATTVN